MPRGAFLLAFAGISEIKAAEREIEVARAYLDSIIATIRQPLVVLDEELCVISASSSFYRVLSVKPEELIGRYLLAAGDHLNVPALREFLVSIQARGTTITAQDVEMELGIFDERSRAARGAFSKTQDPGGDRRRHRGEARGQSAGGREIRGGTGQHRQVALSRGRQP